MSPTKHKLEIATDVPNEIHMTRAFAAPRRLVIRAMTTPELLQRWLGGERATVVSATVDLRVGGKYRHLYKRRRDGGEFAFVGEFREISDARIVYVESFEGQPGEALVTASYDERDGQTILKLVMRFPSQAIRDMVLATGMSEGAGESYDHLEALLATLA
jgi:uncharacterized protein YndB with AHSA1/START domain